MLWSEVYRPKGCDEIIGQDEVIRYLVSFAESGSVPHMLISGPHGTGKTAAVECLARRLYADNWEANTTIFSATDLLGRGKSALEEDERFSHIYQKGQSRIVNFKYIVKWYASMRPLDAPFKLMVFEDAHDLTFEAQQALRRTMERYSATCRFIFITTRPSAIIPAIASRCLPLFFAPLKSEVVRARLEEILAAESATLPADDLDLVVHAARGDLRRAIIYLQLAVRLRNDFDLAEVSRSETGNMAESAFDTLRAGNFDAASRIVESLMIEYGLSPQEVVQELRQVIRREYNHPVLAVALADTDYRLCHNANDFVQVNALLARIASEVFL
ncbi:MAG TPA: AAA family ATPase [Candidatus Methanoculleus thermohydrogenotrophicum]|jgi:replication factor C small subunit|nr:AAA family ATPase [Candidatus Methanoculleus thermohydrogenotrophicum]NLM82117.1 AAA family ATPase [Candidatus Methanoculleus thermohydrogenotrophicum]HOB18351.1 AAA family ATPase [Candidatus Methanoculleus thermohydrogenotrophicum]HPZ37838.1 AAA family ATPase [Candidatus Methanoculleus thermohydrogenotrophicum]HQC91064.1 AAA family ATPase [Candidatus Methanoculleus thermohydrogenotrophicum]